MSQIKFNSSSIIWNYMKVLNMMNYYTNESLIYYINLLLEKISMLSDIRFFFSCNILQRVVIDL